MSIAYIFLGAVVLTVVSFLVDDVRPQHRGADGF